MRTSRYRLLLRAIALILAAASLPWTTPAAMAQDYPSKPVTLIIPWPPGGATDIAMRAIAEAASKHLGQPIVIDNKAGGSGAVGPATMAASAKPDGYTISQIPITVFRLPLMQQTSWDAEKDFSYIVHLTGYTFGVTTHVDTPFKKWQDVIDYAKANPGKVTYATPGAGDVAAHRHGADRGQERASSSPRCRSRAMPSPTPPCSAIIPCCRPTAPAGSRWSMPASCAC